LGTVIAPQEKVLRGLERAHRILRLVEPLPLTDVSVFSHGLVSLYVTPVYTFDEGMRIHAIDVLAQALGLENPQMDDEGFYIVRNDEWKVFTPTRQKRCKTCGRIS